VGTHLGQTGAGAECRPCEGICCCAIGRFECRIHFAGFQTSLLWIGLNRLDSALGSSVWQAPCTGSRSPVHLARGTGDRPTALVPMAALDQVPGGVWAKTWSPQVCCQGGECGSLKERDRGGSRRGTIEAGRVDRRLGLCCEMAGARNPGNPSSAVSGQCPTALAKVASDESELGRERIVEWGAILMSSTRGPEL